MFNLQRSSHVAQFDLEGGVGGAVSMSCEPVACA